MFNNAFLYNRRRGYGCGYSDPYCYSGYGYGRGCGIGYGLGYGYGCGGYGYGGLYNGTILNSYYGRPFLY